MLDKTEFVLQPGATPPSARDAKKAAAPPANKKLIVIDFYADRSLERTAVADAVVSDAADGRVLAKLQLHLTARTCYAQLLVAPDRSLYFGDVASGRNVSKNFTIENVGEFPTEVRLLEVEQSIMEFINSSQMENT